MGADMFSRTPLAFFLAAALLLSSRVTAQENPLSSRPDPALDYPIRVVEAEPFLRPGTDMSGEGDFRPVHRELGTLPAERMRLPVPGSTWRLDGRVVRTEEGTLYAAFGTYLYRSDDDGRSWTGRRLQGLPNTRGEPVAAQAFGAAGPYILVCHAATGLPPVMSELVENPAVVCRQARTQSAGHLPFQGRRRALGEQPSAQPPSRLWGAGRRRQLHHRPGRRDPAGGPGCLQSGNGGGTLGSLR